MIKSNPNIPLVLFAKAPIAGQVKTRLTTDCSQQQAADIAEILLKESLAKAIRYWPGKVYLSIWQFEQHPFIVSLLEQFNVELLLQSTGDLGEKMQKTFDQFGYPAAIMGCDAPLVTQETFKHTYKALSAGENAIGPSEDGGYYLIGLSQPAPVLFDGVSWGGSSVLAQTLTLASIGKIELVKLRESYDVDRWDDVLRASTEIPTLQAYLKSQD